MPIIPWRVCFGIAYTTCPPTAAPNIVPIMKGVIHVSLIWRQRNKARVKFEFTWIIACVGMTANGGSKDAMITINMVPPPKPKAADMTDVKKLVIHSVTKAELDTPGALVVISWMKSILKC